MTAPPPRSTSWSASTSGGRYRVAARRQLRPRQDLAGQLLGGPPHDYEPSPADAATFQGAKLIVVNGAHYDEWASKLAASSAPNAPVINAAETGGEEPHEDHGTAGDHDHDHGEVNPHVWYNPPATVTAVADAVTAKLGELAPPAAKDYFADRRSAFTTSMQPYTDTIAKIKTGGGR